MDRRTQRTVPMQILVLGFPRTGTTSMRAALEILEYHDMHHMEVVLKNPLEAELWTAAINARFFGRGTPYGRAEWDQLLGHCEVVADNPAILFATDLIAAYPDAKVILTNRDVDKWWTSYRESIINVTSSRRYRLAAALDPQGLGKFATFARFVMSAHFGPVITEEGAKARFIEHYDNIRKLVPKERLLEYEVKDGWGPLCTFLGRDVPTVEFPRTNDTKMFIERRSEIVSMVYRRFVVEKLIPCVVMAGVAWAIYAKSARVK
ncbi:P-loop containing nucleoside triphosphate hydrolase protein [Mycena latifolia]|nr:P-loop containing nucleoside triphosphate hydrolase protein [Mycena latifolia]